MTSHAVMKAAVVLHNSIGRVVLLVVLGLGFILPAASAKEPSLTAIELYDGTSGGAFVQLGDVLINGKAEVRDCTQVQSGTVEKSVYGKLPKITLAPGGVMERGADGVLKYGTAAGNAICVVPDNVKFEHNEALALSSLAEHADLRGNPVAQPVGSAATVQPIKIGVKLVFVAAPDAELAEFLLAQRVSDIPSWQNFLAKYPSSAHFDDAKRALASLYVAAGEKALAAYQKTSASETPSFADLKDAWAQELLAHALLPDLEPSAKLAGKVRSELTTLIDKGRAELDKYKSALESHTAGFAHLITARRLADAVSGVDSAFQPGQKLLADVNQSRNAIESALQSAGSAADSKQWDDALNFVIPYGSFAVEEPRIARIIDGDYNSHFEQGKQFEQARDWAGAIKQYQSAVKAKDTAEAQESLKTVQGQLLVAQDELAAKSALEKSKNYELQKDMIEAYEVLTSLTTSQQAIVADEIKRLAPGYVAAASQRAKELTKAYPTIQGIGDEREIEKAYVYLQRAYQLGDDDPAKDSYKSRMENLGDELSAWFLDRAKHYLDKPLGSGTELGWAYLKEAESYRAANLEAVRDQIKLAEPAHSMHSKLSIRVQFRDQTSQRQSEGFANQMENSIITGLDTSGLPVKVVRFGEQPVAGAEPDFQLAGDVLEHHVSAPPTIEPVDSKYVAGVHEIPSEEWNKANRAYDSASSELHTAQAALQGAEAKGNKKEINELNRRVADAQKRVDDARVYLDSIAKSKTEDIIRSYTYKRVTYEVNNTVNLQIRIDESGNGQKGDTVQVPKQDKKRFVVLTDVNPEDINGVKASGTTPDTTELQTELENSARADLIVKVREKVAELPHKIYESARKKAEDGYMDDAGEAYLRFLNIMSPEETSERKNSEKFLHEQFNFLVFPSLAP